jgi:hypothetical protein
VRNPSQKWSSPTEGPEGRNDPQMEASLFSRLPADLTRSLPPFLSGDSRREFSKAYGSGLPGGTWEACWKALTAPYPFLFAKKGDFHALVLQKLIPLLQMWKNFDGSSLITVLIQEKGKETRLYANFHDNRTIILREVENFQCKKITTMDIVKEKSHLEAATDFLLAQLPQCERVLEHIVSISYGGYRDGEGSFHSLVTVNPNEPRESFMARFAGITRCSLGELGQRIEEPEEVSIPPTQKKEQPGKCEALTKKGIQCKNKAKKGKFCHVHAV